MVSGREPTDVTFAEMQQGVGQLFLVWIPIETAFREANTRFGIRPNSPSAAAAIDAWRDRILQSGNPEYLIHAIAEAIYDKVSDARRVRNGICHGLNEVSGGTHNRPASLSWDADGQQFSLSHEDLQNLLKWLSCLQRALSILSSTATDSPSYRLEDTEENRDWWREEFQIELLPC